MKSNKKFYIGERQNPQLSKSYYNAYGQLSKTEAKNKEKCSYGSMYLTSFDTEELYNNRINELKSQGFKVY